MGFLRKIFSIRSRRSKKKRIGMDADLSILPSVPDLRHQHEDQELTASRLLRSSSAHFAVMGEVDYSSLPPLPHPIHRVFHTPTASVSSLPSVSQRGTYTVKVLPRTIHTRAEFPNANPLTPQRSQYGSICRRSKSVPITPRDKTRLQGLRQDPSVASLLQMYDDHGCLDSKVFSNSPTSPENEGRSQLRRGGSTLRQLMGGSPTLSARDARDTSAAEGDISWAERCLCESTNSSTSSLGVQTPNDALFPNAPFTHNHDDNTMFNLHDMTINGSDPYPAFSSLEVELSMVAEDLPASDKLNSNYPYENDNLMTPQRASQVFAFLTARKSQTRRQSGERPLPALPASVQTPSSRFSSYSSSAGSHESDIPSSIDTHTNTNFEPDIRETESNYNQACPKWPSESNRLEPRRRNQKTTMISPNTLPDDPNSQQVIVISGPEMQSNSFPRGPRPPPLFLTNSTQPSPPKNQYQSHLNSSSPPREPRRSYEQTPTSNNITASAPDLPISDRDDTFTPIPSRQSHRRTPSRSTTSLLHVSSNYDNADLTRVVPTNVKPVQAKELKEKSPVHDKENGREEAVLYKAQLLPMTPVRSRSVFRAPNGLTPSPASSSDLSPVAQQLMTDLRTQRMQARERQKRNGRWSSTTSKLKW